MKQTITRAIKEMAVLRFTYKGQTRTVEPHTLGYDTNGRLVLCAWQTRGGSGEGFRDFHVNEISELIITSNRFLSSRPGYRRGDSTMTIIVSELY